MISPNNGRLNQEVTKGAKATVCKRPSKEMDLAVALNLEDKVQGRILGAAPQEEIKIKKDVSGTDKILGPCSKIRIL